MIKTKNNKGDDKMIEHKDLWLVIGLTMILAVTVSISSVAITGDAVFGKVTKATTVSTSIKIPKLVLPSLYGQFEVTPNIMTLYDKSGKPLYTDAHVIQVRVLNADQQIALKDLNNINVNTFYMYKDSNTNTIQIFTKNSQNPRPMPLISAPMNSFSAIKMGSVVTSSTTLPLYILKWVDGGFKLSIGGAGDYDSGYTEKVQLYFKESRPGQFNYLGHRPTGGTFQKEDLVYIQEFNPNNLVDMSSYQMDVLTNNFNIIVKSPRAGIESDQLTFWVPR